MKEKYNESGYTFVACKEYFTSQDQPYVVNISFQALFL